jgi:2-keto-3-deoxy-L-rhamnonate aldolase RhmA
MRLLWQQIPSTIISEIYCNTKFDGIVLDTEHAAWYNESIFQHIQLITALNKKCFIRLTEINKTLIRICLDANCDGLIFSTIETITQATEIYNQCSYNQNRGLGLVRENQWGKKNFNFKTKPYLIGQIETHIGVKNSEKLKDHFDYLMVGPYDLSRDIGLPGDFNNKEYLELIKEFNNNTDKSGRAIHIVKNNDIKKQLKKYKDYELICSSMDTILLTEGLDKLEKLI